MRWFPVLALACTPAAPTLAGLESSLRAGGEAPLVEADHLRLRGADYDVLVALFADPTTVRLSTQGLYSLDQAGDPRGTVRLLTAIATLDDDLPLGRVSLDASTGEIRHTIDLLAEPALGDAALGVALQQLRTQADALLPRLQRSAAP